MDEFPLIRDHRTLLQGRGVIGAEGCLGIRSSEGKSAPTQDDRKNKRKKDNMFDSDWPELVSLDDFDPSPRSYDAKDFLPGVASLSLITPRTNPTKTKQQKQVMHVPALNGASDAPLNCDARASSSSGISAAELFVPFDNMELGNQIGCCEGLETILSPSHEMQVPTASSSMCSGETVASSTFSGPDSVAPHIPRPSKKPHDPFRGAPDMILEEMAENPLDMYFPPLATYQQQPEKPTSDATSAQKHRFPEEFAGSHSLNRAESQLCSKEMASAGLHGQPSSAMVLEAVPVKELGFHKLQEGMNQLDLATKGCIRDALYRLANGVEQRHVAAGSSGRVGSSGSKRFRSGHGWTETQTNPMDQSVAQLLLKKPSYGKAAQPHRVT